MHLPEVCESSYKLYDRYPEQLVWQGRFPLALQTYRSRLDNIALNLFIEDNATAHVPFRDWMDATQGK